MIVRRFSLSLTHLSPFLGIFVNSKSHWRGISWNMLSKSHQSISWDVIVCSFTLLVLWCWSHVSQVQVSLNCPSHKMQLPVWKKLCWLGLVQHLRRDARGLAWTLEPKTDCQTERSKPKVSCWIWFWQSSAFFWMKTKIQMCAQSHKQVGSFEVSDSTDMWIKCLSCLLRSIYTQSTPFFL